MFILFGVVSISKEYSSTSRELLINFLKHNMYDPVIARRVKPRNPYKNKKLNNMAMPNFNDKSIEGLSALISSFEEDEKGVPVLIRQYMKLGGQMLGFNIDHEFSDCVDGLMRVDLRNIDEKVLSKYMGKEQAQSYLAYWRNVCRAAV